MGVFSSPPGINFSAKISNEKFLTSNSTLRNALQVKQKISTCWPWLMPAASSVEIMKHLLLLYSWWGWWHEPLLPRIRIRKKTSEPMLVGFLGLSPISPLCLWLGRPSGCFFPGLLFRSAASSWSCHVFQGPQHQAHWLWLKFPVSLISRQRNQNLLSLTAETGGPAFRQERPTFHLSSVRMPLCILQMLELPVHVTALNRDHLECASVSTQLTMALKC